jgi:hypothetical protein
MVLEYVYQQTEFNLECEGGPSNSQIVTRLCLTLNLVCHKTVIPPTKSDHVTQIHPHTPN